jgi:hypothetical protein
MSALALILTAAMVIPANVPEKESGEIGKMANPGGYPSSPSCPFRELGCKGPSDLSAKRRHNPANR